MRPVLPKKIQMLNVTPGTTSSQRGGVYVDHNARVTARIENDHSGVFHLIEVETDDVVPELDVPSGHPLDVLQTALVIEGPGPIDVFESQAVRALVHFSCPADPAQGASFDANVVFEGAGLPSPVILQIFATSRLATVEGFSLTSPSILQGHTESITLRIRSTFGHSVDVTCDYDSVFEPGFSATPQSRVVPAGGSIDLTIPLTCSPGLSPGNKKISFQLRATDNSQFFGSIEAEVKVLVFRSVSVSTFPEVGDLVLPHRSELTIDIKAIVSGGPATFFITPGQIPPQLSLTGGQQSIVVDGTGLMRLTIKVEPNAPIGSLGTNLVINWTVAADEVHDEEAGSVAWNIVTSDPVTVSWERLHCIEQEDTETPIIDVEDDEPYIVVMSINGSGRGLGPGNLIQLPESRVFLVGPMSGIDKADVKAAPANALWGLNGPPGSAIPNPAPISDINQVFFLVSLLEHDHRDPAKVSEAIVTLSQAGIPGIWLDAQARNNLDSHGRFELFVDLAREAMDGAIDLARLDPLDPDDKIGPVQVLRFSTKDHTDVIGGLVLAIEHTLRFQGDDADYELTFALRLAPA